MTNTHPHILLDVSKLLIFKMNEVLQCSFFNNFSSAELYKKESCNCCGRWGGGDRNHITLLVSNNAKRKRSCYMCKQVHMLFHMIKRLA
jgi:hypothetical protein